MRDNGDLERINLKNSALNVSSKCPRLASPVKLPVMELSQRHGGYIFAIKHRFCRRTFPHANEDYTPHLRGRIYPDLW